MFLLPGGLPMPLVGRLDPVGNHITQDRERIELDRNTPPARPETCRHIDFASNMLSATLHCASKPC